MGKGRTKDGVEGDGDNGGGQQAQKPSQVFLRNLPLAMLEPDIETLLGDCGPIKRIDLIKTMDRETGTKMSRGFGFVTFALEADAAKACETIHGKRVMGRELSCEIALKKGAKREGHGRVESQGDAKQQSQAARSSQLSAPGEKTGTVNTYGGSASAVSAAGKKSPALSSSPKTTAEKEAEVKSSTGKQSKVDGNTEKEAKATGSGSSNAPAVGTGVAVGKGLAERVSAEAGAGISKKEARKAARKEMKKERKAKAKEKAKERKEAKALEDTAAQSATVATAGTEPSADHDVDMDGAQDGEEEAGDGGEPVDPKAAKLQRDAKTLLIFGVADDLTAKQLQKRVKKYATVTALTVEDNDSRFFPAGRVARVECAGKEGTRKIITGIDGHTVHGKSLRARRLMEIVPGHDVRQQKQQRLIVRNLNFRAKEADLAQAFSEFGPLSEVHIPTVRVTHQKRIRGTDSEETVKQDRSRGFGFVQFLCPKDAARVVKDHGVLQICGRDAAVDYSITKEKFNALKQGQQSIASTPTNTADKDDDAEKEGGAGEENEGIPDSDSEEENTSEDGNLAQDDADTDGDSDSDMPQQGGPDAGAGIGRASAAPKRGPDVQHGCTVFVRNVAFDCGEAEVRERFGEFGNVRLALLVKDRATGMARGTAFVKFSNMDEADRCLAAAIGVTDPAHAQDSGGSCIYLGSRALHVTRAVDREEAGRLTVGAQKRVGHKDKRNLYLADEGLVVEDSSAAEGAAKSDMDKRVQARRDKKSKLKNPIFFVSPVRLSVRNLARHVTDAKLKAMAVAAARSGLEAGCSNPQDVRRYLEAQGEEFAAITPQRLQIPQVGGGAVLRSKIIRDMDKKPNADDPDELHPSKGYGFVEFAHHGQALAALRQLNNNPAYSSSARSEGVAKGETSRLIVEFSVENHAMLKLQQTRKEAFEQRKRELKALGLGQDGRPVQRTEDREKKSRGKIQREKKKRKASDSAGDPSDNKDQELEQSQETTEHSSSTESSAKKKRKKSDLAEAKGVKRGHDGGDDGAVGELEGGLDNDTDALVGGSGTEGEDRPKRKKKKKKASKFEHVDKEEHGYRQLEREYTDKAKKVGAKEGPTQGDGEVAEGVSKKRKQGRWFE